MGVQRIYGLKRFPDLNSNMFQARIGQFQEKFRTELAICASQHEIQMRDLNKNVVKDEVP